MNKRLHRLFEVSRVLPLACAPGQQKPQSKNPFEARPFYRTCRHGRKQLKGLSPSIASVRKPKSTTTPTGIIAAQYPLCWYAGWRFAPPHPFKPPHLLPAPHHHAHWSRPYARMRRARAGFEHAARCAKSMPRLPHGDANGNAAQTGGIGAASAAKDEPARQARAPRALLLLF